MVEGRSLDLSSVTPVEKSAKYGDVSNLNLMIKKRYQVFIIQKMDDEKASVRCSQLLGQASEPRYARTTLVL